MSEGRGGGIGGAEGGSEANAHRIRFQELFEFAPDSQLATDHFGVILEANHAASALFRCSKEFLVGKPLGLLLTEGHRTRFYEALARLGRDKEADEFEARVGRPGSARQVQMKAAAVYQAGGTIVFRWFVQDISERRNSEAQRIELLRQLATAQEDERRRVARELHDSVGQLLSVLILGIRAARDAGPIPPPALARLEEVQRIADELVRETHDLAVRLRPTALDDFGLAAALQNHLEEWSSRSGIEAHFHRAGLDSPRFAPEIETALFRIVQEATTNILKHARARLVTVLVAKQDGHAVVVVEDDGVGFDPEAALASAGLGLLGMRERLASLGGELLLESSPGAGTTVRARVPLSSTAGPSPPR